MADKEVVSLTYAGDADQAVDELQRISKTADREGRSVSKDLGRAFVSIEKEARRAGKTIGDSLKAGLDRAKEGGAIAVNSLGKVSAAALAAGAAFAALAADVAGTVDEVGTFSALSGLSAETVNGLRRQADLTNKALSDIIPKDLPKRILETSQNTGEALKGFAALEIEVTNASGSLRTADEILPEVLDKLAKIESPTTKAAIAVQVLGAEGQQMLSAFADSQGLEDAVATAERFGIQVGPDAVAASNAWFKATADLNLAWETAQQALWDAFGEQAVALINNFALGFVYLTSVATNLVEVLKGNQGLDQALAAAKGEAFDFWQVQTGMAKDVDEFVGPVLDELGAKYDDVGILARQAAVMGKTATAELVEESTAALLEFETVGTEVTDNVSKAFNAAAQAIEGDWQAAMETASAVTREGMKQAGDAVSQILDVVIGFSEVALDRQLALSRQTVEEARASGRFTESQLDAIEAREKAAILASFERTKGLQVAAAIVDGIRAGISLIPAFASIPFGLGVPLALGLAAATTGLAVAQIQSQSPPQVFPAGGVVDGGAKLHGLDGGDHVTVGAQVGEGVASLRAMSDRDFVGALEAANRGERMGSSGRARLDVRVTVDRRGRLRAAVGRRKGFGKRP